MWNVSLNYPAIVVAALVPMLIGAGWFSPVLFAHHWMRELGKRPENFNRSRINYLISFAGFIVMSGILSYLIHLLNITRPGEGVVLAVLLWIGFTAAPALINYRFAGRSRNLFFIDMGYHLLSLASMGLILSLWF